MLPRCSMDTTAIAKKRFVRLLLFLQASYLERAADLLLSCHPDRIVLPEGVLQVLDQLVVPLRVHALRSLRWHWTVFVRMRSPVLAVDPFVHLPVVELGDSSVVRELLGRGVADAVTLTATERLRARRPVEFPRPATTCSLVTWTAEPRFDPPEVALCVLEFDAVLFWLTVPRQVFDFVLQLERRCPVGLAVFGRDDSDGRLLVVPPPNLSDRPCVLDEFGQLVDVQFLAHCWR